jgi:hypothetical protein
MLVDLRVKVRTRRSRVASCGWEEFFGLSRQVFAFLNSNSVLKAVISELLARNPDSVNEARTADPSLQLYGETAEAAATLGYVKWESYATQDQPNAFFNHAMSGNGFQDALEKFRDWYVEPLFDYIDEVLDDANIVLAMLYRYKHKVEWYRRAEVMALYEGDTAHGEKHLANHMYEFLFDQGLPFHVEPAAASGRPDVVSLEDSEHPFIGDVKIFAPDSGRGSSYIKKGFYQVYRYCWDYNQPIGHLIVFNVSSKQLRVELPSQPDGVPRFEYNHKTIFLTVVDVHEHEGTASTRGVADTVTISAAELIREVEADPTPVADAESAPKS